MEQCSSRDPPAMGPQPHHTPHFGGSCGHRRVPETLTCTIGQESHCPRHIQRQPPSHTPVHSASTTLRPVNRHTQLPTEAHPNAPNPTQAGNTHRQPKSRPHSLSGTRGHTHSDAHISDPQADLVHTHGLRALAQESPWAIFQTPAHTLPAPGVLLATSSAIAMPESLS